jgi:hypothetical protein
VAGRINFSSALDLSRWVIAFLNDGNLEGKNVLPPKLIATMSSPHAKIPGSDASYGYGLQMSTRRGVKWMEHSGSRAGYGSIIRMAPERKFAVIIVANRTGSSMPKLAEAASEQMLTLAPESKHESPTHPLTAEESKRYAGVYANSSAVIQKRKKSSLELEFEFEVPDRIGCIAVTPDSVIGGNWDSKDFYVWDHRGKLIRKVASTTGNGYQDMKFDRGQIVASGILPDGTGAIDWLEYPSFRLIRRLKAGKNDRGVLFTREGMAIHGSRLPLLPEDGPSRVFFFDLNNR